MELLYGSLLTFNFLLYHYFMKTNLTEGLLLESGFRILDIVPLQEFEAMGIYARHEKTGAEVFHILHDDEENLFAFAFATTPEDSTGIAHIIEHSVLCGSKKYPLKDAFMVLAQGSLQTYLNAWTFPDKTVYPASSTNESDYFNLMSVYGDAVFFPRLDEWTFMQEGRRFEWKGFPSKLSVTGVVYNEMKGAYSALDEYAGQWSIRSVLPDTPYSFDSGGNPACIPDLTFEQFKTFHKNNYCPANARVFLSGNISTEKQLDFINKNFLQEIPAGKRTAMMTTAERWTQPKEYTISAPAAGDDKKVVFLSWLCNDDEKTESLKLSALTEILLGHDGSPLTKALIDSGLGEDLASVCGLESELRQTIFTVGLRGVDKSTNSQAVVELIMNELKRLIHDEIPKADIEAALLNLEFSKREIKRPGGPWALVWLRQSLRGWIHGKKPWDMLLFRPYFDALKQEIKNNGRFFEDLLQKEFIYNPHRALVTIIPEKDFNAKKEKEALHKLKLYEKSLTQTEKKQLKEKLKSLEKIQNEEETKQNLDRIPHLKRGELSSDIEIVPRAICESGGIPVVSHNLFTNGITYCDLAIPVDVLPADDYIWLPLFSRCITSVGTEKKDYAEISRELANTVGGFVSILHTSPLIKNDKTIKEPPNGMLDIAGRDWIILKIKALDEKISPSLNLVQDIFLHADFSDLKRLRDLVLEMKNDVDGGFAPEGHFYAALRATANNSHSRAVSEIWSGITQLQFVHQLAETNIEEISRRLTNIRNTLVSSAGLIINISGKNETETLRGAEIFSGFAPVKNRKEFVPYILNEKNKYEVFSSPTLQIGFAGLSLPASVFGTREAAAENALCNYLSKGPLWTNVRMKGGAYGASAHVNPAEKDFTFTTYRDPNPAQSLSVLCDILNAASGTTIEDDILEKTIIGTYSDIKQPKTPAQHGFADFLRMLHNVTDQDRKFNLENLLSLNGADLKNAAARFAGECTKNSIQIIIAGQAAANAAASKFKVKPFVLPV
ncbi:peptidase M16 [Spirochaetia bacterium]|nr:peptidase M16 [Spirochaetia bacterium]